jgi:GTP-binding protein YchF
MALAVGIVGLPNVGKSTLFNALSDAGAESANYPFCTIEPNHGVVSVPDPRLDELVKIIKPKSIVPTTVEFVDIAGLVKGAAQGEGLGNQFLSNIRSCDAIVHVVRCFSDDNVVHVSGKIDPLDDVDVINTELILRDLQSMEQRVTKMTKLARSGDKKVQVELASVKKIYDGLGEGKSYRSLDLNDDDHATVADLSLLTAKPVLYVANVAEDQLAAGLEDEAVKPLVDYAKAEGAEVVVITAAIESEIAGLEAEERAEFLESLGLEEPGLNRLIRSAYGLLDLITYFTAGEKECRAWTIRQGTLAPGAAGVIHTDFERGFIRAEVINWETLIECGSEANAKSKGLLRVEGKDYLVKDGDVMHFRFNV